MDEAQYTMGKMNNWVQNFKVVTFDLCTKDAKFLTYHFQSKLIK